MGRIAAAQKNDQVGHGGNPLGKHKLLDAGAGALAKPGEVEDGDGHEGC